jgi:YrbI family 3-deoxy-D-manno-octulosonate 8-phosphate phosphatase
MLDNLSKVKLIATDFDGIITDGFVYFSSECAGELKRVSFKDIMGMSLAIKSGYKIAIISGEKNNIIDKVADKFKLDDVHQGIKDKLAVLLAIAEKYKLSLGQICYLGDDINDISILEKVGFAVTVPDCNYKVKNVQDIYVTKASAGNGAFREIIDLLLD